MNIDMSKRLTTEEFIKANEKDRRVPIYDPYLPTRLSMGEAWAICGSCGVKLYSFDGQEDKITQCEDCR